LDVASILDQQRSLFAARARNIETRKHILQKRIDELDKQSVGVRKQLAGTRKQLALVREEMNTVAALLEQGYARKPRLLAIQRAEANLVATEGELAAQLSGHDEEIGQIEFQIASLKTAQLEQVDAKLSQVQAERVGAEKLYRQTRDRLARTRIVAPVSGIVLDVRVTTVGGVIRPSEPILDIAPVSEELIIEANIRPIDIDEVVAGAPTMVAFPAYQARYVRRVQAELVRVSADTIEGARGETPHYLATIKLDRAHLAAVAPNVTLAAGMPVEVFIITAERTLFDFLAAPIHRIFERSLRES
jgi:HlyD family secretion protein